MDVEPVAGPRDARAFPARRTSSPPFKKPPLATFKLVNICGFASLREVPTPSSYGQKLIIAEKPSVAGDIARALGGFKKNGDFFESDQHLVSSAIGHLVELAAPEGVEVKRGKWNLENLPVLPEEFDLRPIEKTEARFKLLKKLIKRPDIDGLINACDAGREGELIFRNLVKLAGVKKPVQPPLAPIDDPAGDPDRLRAPAHR